MAVLSSGHMTINPATSPSLPEPDDEIIAWLWLAYHSDLPLRRVKEIIAALLTDAISLHAALQDPALLAKAGLSDVERQNLARYAATAAQARSALRQWQGMGIMLWRQNQPGYPDTLHRHLPTGRRPLLLSTLGQPGLLDMPLIMPIAGEPPEDEATAWTVAVLHELSTEGALPLLVAESGFPATLARRFLQTDTPFALVMPQGLATYTPPPGLRSAIEQSRALLLSPFAPGQELDNSRSTLPPTRGFARALAHGLLMIMPPYPTDLLPEQPCFLRPGIPKTVGCQHEYSDVEDLFLRLSEVPLAAAPYITPSAAPASPTPNEPPPDPEALIARLERLGHVPDMLKKRLRGGPSSDHAP